MLRKTKYYKIGYYILIDYVIIIGNTRSGEDGYVEEARKKETV